MIFMFLLSTYDRYVDEKMRLATFHTDQIRMFTWAIGLGSISHVIIHFKIALSNPIDPNY